MSLDVFHLIPQSQVIDMTGGRFGNMAFGVSVTQDIWNSTRSPRAIATRFHQFTLKTSLPARDAVLNNFASKTPASRSLLGARQNPSRYLKDTKRPPGSYIDTRIVIMQQLIHLAKEDSELSKVVFLRSAHVKNNLYKIHIFSDTFIIFVIVSSKGSIHVLIIQLAMDLNHKTYLEKI